MNATSANIHPATYATMAQAIGRFLDDGIARFGSVDAFHAALATYNAEQGVAR